MLITANPLWPTPSSAWLVNNYLLLLFVFCFYYNSLLTYLFTSLKNTIKLGISTQERFTDGVRDDQIQRGITIKSTGLSLYFDIDAEDVPPNSDGNGFLFNMIDSPGHVDFSSEGLYFESYYKIIIKTNQPALLTYPLYFII